MTAATSRQHVILLSLLCLGSLATTGCRHRTRTVIPIAPTTPVPLAPAPEPTSPVEVPAEPTTPTPLPAIKPKIPHKPKPKAAPAAAAPAPAQVAAVTPPPDLSVIGLLSAGDGSTESRQKLAASITALEKRLQGLPASARDTQKDAVIRVQNFIRQARTALDSGDLDGANTLSTKARVLLDDLAK